MRAQKISTEKWMIVITNIHDDWQSGRIESKCFQNKNEKKLSIGLDTNSWISIGFQ